MKSIQFINNIVHAIMSAGIVGMMVVISLITPLTPSWAVDNSDYTAVPPFLSTEVKPNVLFIIDNSNSMDEDVNGAAVGSASPLSRSEIARKAILQIINENKDTMRFGVMAYEQTGVVKRYVHNSFYYASYDSTTFHPDHAPTPKDPSDNTKRFPNPTSTDEFIYYDTALPFYASNSQGIGFCYSPDFTEDGDSSNDFYRCYHIKTGDETTPEHLPNSAGQDETDFGYANHFHNYHFVPTDDDFAAGFTEFGYEMSWVPVSDTWFSNSSPGGGILHTDIADSTDAHLADIQAKLATSQFSTSTDTPLRNAGLTPLAGTLKSARTYFQNAGVTTASGVTATNPITLSCQKNYIILVTDGLPSVDSTGTAGDADTLLPEVEASIAALRTTDNPSFSSNFDIKTFVVGFAIPDELGSKLDALAVAGGTDDNGHALLAHSATELAAKLKKAFLGIKSGISSGAAVSVISNTRSGEGVVYQSVFYPEIEDSFHNKVAWVGNVNALFVDAYGNLREDTNHNHMLDIYPEDGCQFASDPFLSSWCNNGRVDTEDQDGDWFLDQHDEDNLSIPTHEDWNGNGILDDEDVDDDGFVDIDEDLQEFPMYPEWYNNGILDDEDVDNDGKLDIDEDQVDHGIPGWIGNGILDDEDIDNDGHLDLSNEDAQLIVGHEDWQNNGHLDTEDVDGDGRLDIDEDQVDHGISAWIGNRATHPTPDTEDVDGDGRLDIDEDQIDHGISAWIGNRATHPSPDTEDIDGDGHLDEQDEDVDHDGHLDVIEPDVDGDGVLDTVDEDLIDHGIPSWIGNGTLDTEDTNNNGILETYDEDATYDSTHPTWQNNNHFDTEDVNHNGVLDPAEDSVDYGTIGWKNNGNMDTEDVDGDGVLDTVNEDQQSFSGHADWQGNGNLDREDTDQDGFCDVVEDNQIIDGHPTWRNNGLLDTEDSNHNGHLDAGEDTDGDGVLDTEDFDGDGLLSTVDEDTNSNGVCDTEDVDGDNHIDVNEDLNANGTLDYEDQNHNGHLDSAEDIDDDSVIDTEDYNGNGVFDRTEDLNGNGILDTEDINGDGHLDVNEDLDGDGHRDLVNEDLDGDGHLDVDEDIDNDHILDTEDIDNDGRLDLAEDIDHDGILDDEDIDHDGILDVAEDTNNNHVLDTEDLDGDGNLDHGEDLNHNGVMDTEDLDGDGHLDVNEDRNGNGIIDTEDYDGDGKLDYAEDTNHNGIVDTEDLDGDGHLDVDEDLNHNGRLDFEVDHNGNGVFDSTDFIIVYGHDANGVKAFRYEDSNGNGRLDLNEDLNGNGQLDYDLNEDINGNGTLDPGEDLNNNNILDTDVDEDRNGNGLLDIDEDANNDGVMNLGEDLNGDGKFYTEDTLIDTVQLEDINYVWDASSWLNEISDADIIKQRIYGQADDRRYIFTFNDQDSDKVVDDGEAIAFVTDDSDQPDNYDKLAPYLTEYPHRSDEPDWVQTIRDAGNWNHFLARQTKRTINFVRGLDEEEYTSTTPTPYTLPAMRTRKVDYDKDGTLETWRLGDIIHSAPTLVARPAEEYHLLYNDSSYAEFADKYAYRRNVVYVGGNDGMIHAFNGGFFDSINLGLSLRSKTKAEQYFDANHNNQWDAGEPFFDVDGDGVYDAGFGSETPYPLGMELWAYIPENLLPHLRWLTNPEYQHVYYNDLRPKVVDAKIFTEESSCHSNIYASDCIHPHGWGTLLISGMRFGGGEYPKSATWDFDTDAAGWTFSDNSVSQTFVDGAWTIETTHGVGNPSILSPDNLTIDASRVKTVKIRFLTTAMDAGAGGARLYWDINGDGNFTEGSQTINAPSVDTSGKYYVYTFDMSENSHWKDTITQLRIDPQGAFTAGSKMAIDYVDLGDGKGYVSSYVLIDVTNPEIPPKVLAEINLLGLGYTTSLPTVIPLKSKTDANKNDWYLVFGSGINHNSLADPAALTHADSNTTGKIFVLSLNKLLSQHKIEMLDSSGTLHDIQKDGEQTFATLGENSFMSDLITVDFDMDYDADVVYFGTVSGNATEDWGGKLRRILLHDGDTDTSSWNGDSVLLTLAANQSITAKPNISIDDKDKFWVYFGTGRFYTRDDINIYDTQSYFGVKEPVDADGNKTFAEVPTTDLLNTTNAVVYDDKTVQGMGTLNTWDKLMAEIDTNKFGWTIDFPGQRERNLGQAAVLGGVLTFTTYQPSADLCSTDGWSYGYGLYYKTGTAYYKSIIGFDFTDGNGNGKVDDGLGEKKIEKSFSIGAGLALSPAIHAGKEKGTKAYIQTSGGLIFGMSEDNPGLTKSSKVSWGQIQ